MARIKQIALWQGSSRNFGDLCINHSMKKLFKRHSNQPLEFLDINSDLTYDPQGYRNYPPPSLSDELIEEINDTCDMLIVGGGGQIMAREPHESVSGWQFNVPLSSIEKIKVPLITYGIGYNKFPRDPTFFYRFNKHLGATYKHSKLFSVRNEGTANIVRQTIGNEDPIYMVADPALFVEGKPLNIPKLGDKPVLGLNWAGDTPYRRFSMNEEHDLFMELLDFCKKWVADTGGKILYIPHVMIYDFAKFASFKEHLGGSIVGLHIECPWLYPESLVGVPLFVGAYKACTAVLAMRGHGNIVPTGQGVPAYGYGTQEKVKFFSEEMGTTFLGNNPMSYYTQFYDEVFTNREQTLARMSAKRSELYDQTGWFVQMCLAYLE